VGARLFCRGQKSKGQKTIARISPGLESGARFRLSSWKCQRGAWGGLGEKSAAQALVRTLDYEADQIVLKVIFQESFQDVLVPHPKIGKIQKFLKMPNRKKIVRKKKPTLRKKSQPKIDI
jgi:hypothetical protein